MTADRTPNDDARLDRDDDFERIARNAARALRRPAPADAVQRLHELRGRRQRMRGVAVSVVALAVVLGGLVAIATRDEPSSSASAATTSASDTATAIDGTTSVTAATQPFDRLRDTARAYADAVLHGTPAQVTAFYSSSCTDPLTATQLDELRSEMETAADMSLASIAATGAEVRNFVGSEGEVNVSFNVPPSVQGNDNWILYRLENGSWHVANCNQLPFGGNSTQSISSSSLPGPGLTARIELPLTTVAAGTTLQGYLVVSNTTGATAHVLDGDCQPKWGVSVTNAHVPPNSAFTADCRLAPLDLPIGETRLPVTVYTSYSGCQQGSAAGTGSTIFPACLPSGPPPLPSGDYTAVLVGNIPGLTPPPPVAITLTP